MGDLLDKVLEATNLHLAWEEVANNKGMAGVDDVTIQRWGRNWEERLHEIIYTVRKRRYRPKALRIRRIPKRQPGEFRTLLIPTVTDRVLQRAVLQVLHPLFEQVFLDCSFGYRPERGLKDAVQRILTLRRENYLWVLDADIDAFFDSIHHGLLLRLLDERIKDQSVLNLIELWLNVSANDGVGIALGSPLSPLLANVYLHPFDFAVQQGGYAMIRYADDFIILSRSREEVEESYAIVEMALSNLSLKLEPSKTHLTHFSSGFTFLGVFFQDDHYTFNIREKKVQVEGDEVIWFFNQYAPEYEG